MTQIIKIAKWEYLNRVKTKLFIITTLLLPVLFALISILPTWLATLDPEKTSKIGLIYGSKQTALINDFKILVQNQYKTKNGMPEFSFVNIDNDQNALSKILDKTIQGYLSVSPNILDSGQVEYYSLSLSNIRQYSNLKNALQNTVINHRLDRAGIDVSLIKQLNENIGFKTFELDEDGSSKSGNKIADIVVPMIFVFVLFMIIFTSGQLLLRSVMEERTSRTIELLLSTVNPLQLMTGKILGLGLLGVTQMVIYVLTAFIANHYKNWGVLEYSQIPVLLIYFLLGYLFYASIFAMIGTFFSSEQEAQQSTSIISFIAILPFIFGSYFISNPSSYLTTVFSYIPPLTPFMMIMRIGMGTVETLEIIYTSFLLVISCLLMLKLSGKLFKVTILMYGKRISIKEIYKWIIT